MIPLLRWFRLLRNSALVSIASILVSTAPLCGKSIDVNATRGTVKTHRYKERARKRREARLAKGLTDEKISNMKGLKGRKARERTETKFLSTMSYEEIRVTKNKMAKEGNRFGAIKYIKKMIPQCTDLEELRELTLEVADLLFDDGKLQEAGRMYDEFTKLYPGSDSVEYAAYKAILCNFYDILDAERDQSKTHETITLTENFLQRTDVFKTHTKDVQRIAHTCNQRLVDSEFNIIDFHLKVRENLKAAKKRLDDIKKDFLAMLPEIEPRILEYEITIAARQNNTVHALEIKTDLETRFPQYMETIVASNKKKRSFTNRF